MGLLDRHARRGGCVSAAEDRILRDWDDEFVRLTPEEAAELARLRALKDKAYRATPLGLLAGRYIRWMRNERGATKSTMVGYEAVVADLCVRWGDQPVDGLEP